MFPSCASGRGCELDDSNGFWVSRSSDKRLCMLLLRKREFPEKMSAAHSKVPKAARMKERTFLRREER
jgi:hypothetical protein